MVWVVYNVQQYQATLNEIGRQSDRGAALIAAALLEEHLTLSIKNMLVNDTAALNKMFKGTGPLASFSAKIDLGLLLKLYPKNADKTLHTIREIRNEFAHNVHPVTFRSQRVKDLCANLTTTKHYRKGLIKSFERVWSEELIVQYGVRNLLKPSAVPRRQFIRSVQFMLFYLRLNLHLQTLPETPQPPTPHHS